MCRIERLLEREFGLANRKRREAAGAALVPLSCRGPASVLRLLFRNVVAEHESDFRYGAGLVLINAI
jgi:hypothetical protein